MRAILMAVLLLSSAAAVSGDSAAADAGPPRPNFVIIMFDDMSPRVGAFGDRIAHTPNLDAFAKEAIRFPNTFTAAPVCAPSRAALFSGRYQQTITGQHMRTHGIVGLPGGGPVEYSAVPPPAVKWFPELLRRAGYFTINVGKTDYQIGEPFTIWDVNAMQADWTKRPANKPFLAFINLHRTHESYIWPEDLESTNPLVQRVVARNRQELAGKPPLTDPATVRVPAYLPDTPAVRADIARVYDNIAFDERDVGTIMARLRAEGVLDNTVVIVSADHGDGLPRMKRAIYDAGLRVPLMVRLPRGVASGTVRRQLISFVDLAPTILRLAHLPVPTWMQGKPFLGGAAPNRYVYAGADRFDEVPEWQRTVIDGRYQYIRNHLPNVPFLRPLAFRDVLPSMQDIWRLHGERRLSPTIEQYLTAPRPLEELYDLRADPDTVRNIAADPGQAGTLRRLRAAYAAWTRRVGDDSRVPEKTMIERIWPHFKEPTTSVPLIALRGSATSRLAVLSDSTPGSSTGYRLGTDLTTAWRLYSAPVRLDPGQQIQAKAVRYGYAESAVATAKAP